MNNLFVFCNLNIVIIVFTLNAGMLLEKANNHYNSGDLPAAIELYLKAASEGESRTLCYFNCANAYFQLDSIPQSIVYYNASLLYATDFFRGYLNLAIAFFTLDDIGSCIATITRALELEPDNEQAMLILAVSFRNAGSLPDAITSFEKLLLQHPSKEEAYIALAEMYRELNDEHLAIEWLLKYPEGGKNEAYVHQMLSEIYEANNNYQQALQHTRAAFSLEPTNRWLFQKICTLLNTMGNDLVALEESKRGLEQFPDFDELAVFAGNIAFKYEKYSEANRLFAIGSRLGNPFAVVGLDNIRKIEQEKTRELP